MNRTMSEQYNFVRLCRMARVAAANDFEPDADCSTALMRRIGALEDSSQYRCVTSEEDQSIVRRAYIISYRHGWHNAEHLSHG